MYKQTSSIAKGLCIGAAAGAALAVFGTQYAMNNKKKLKKKASKAMNTVENIMGNMDSMFRS